ncbi:hypothetical protein OFC08_28555, partial [Escherichia coli]|nr:hypothetical protein [Escherichia coli]
DKDNASNSPACPDLHTLIFRLTDYIAQKLSNLTVCFGARFGVFTGVNQRAVENYAQRFC